MSSLNFRQPPSPQETGVPFEMQEYHSRKATYGVGEEDFICMSRIEEAEREMGERRKNEEDAQNRLVSFDSWYTTKVKEIKEFTPSSVKVLQEAVMQHTTGRVDRLTMDELAGVVGLVPPADVPLNLVHSREGLLDKVGGLRSMFFFAGSEPKLTGKRSEHRTVRPANLIKTLSSGL
eukprot:gene26292-17385_t